MINQQEHEADIAFLVARADKAGRVNFGEPRDYGSSSNAIIRLAYGGAKPGEDELPRDKSDLLACLRAVKKLPEHRKTDEVLAAVESAKFAVGCPEIKVAPDAPDRMTFQEQIDILEKGFS